MRGGARGAPRWGPPSRSRVHGHPRPRLAGTTGPEKRPGVLGRTAPTAPGRRAPGVRSGQVARDSAGPRHRDRVGDPRGRRQCHPPRPAPQAHSAPGGAGLRAGRAEAAEAVSPSFRRHFLESHAKKPFPSVLSSPSWRCLNQPPLSEELMHVPPKDRIPGKLLRANKTLRGEKGGGERPQQQARTPASPRPAAGAFGEPLGPSVRRREPERGRRCSFCSQALGSVSPGREAPRGSPPTYAPSALLRGPLCSPFAGQVTSMPSAEPRGADASPSPPTASAQLLQRSERREVVSPRVQPPSSARHSDVRAVPAARSGRPGTDSRWSPLQPTPGCKEGAGSAARAGGLPGTSMASEHRCPPSSAETGRAGLAGGDARRDPSPARGQYRAAPPRARTRVHRTAPRRGPARPRPNPHGAGFAPARPAPCTAPGPAASEGTPHPRLGGSPAPGAARPSGLQTAQPHVPGTPRTAASLPRARSRSPTASCTVLAQLSPEHPEQNPSRSLLNVSHPPKHRSHL